MGARAITSSLGDRWRSARTRVAGSAIVLTYHRIVDLPHDTQRLAVSVERFDEQMRLLSTSYNPMGAGELFDLIARRRRIPDRSVVVTIDDGYSDALLNAKTVLTARSVPAAVFVSSDYIGGGMEFWWDELERIVLGAEALPSHLDIDIGGARYCRAVASDPASAGQRDSTPGQWDVTMPASNERQRIYLDLREFVLPLSSTDRAAALDSLRTQLGADAIVRPSHRPLTTSELRELGEGGTVEIGAHTASHQMLSARTHDEQRNEITGCRHALEQACGREVRLFSYPYGAADSFSESTARIVREAGFIGAFTTRFGAAFPWTSRFSVPRCPTENVNGAEFSERLDRWFEMGR